jgi:cell division protein FtsQ
MRARWLLLSVVIVAVGGAAIVLHSPVFAVDRIDIFGAQRTDVASVVQELGVGPGALLVWVDTAAVHDAIASEPWISDVRVSRIWPGTVEIEVIEREPVAWIEGVFGWMLVARDGTVVERTVEPNATYLQAAVAFPDADLGDRPQDPEWTEVVDMARVLSDDIGSSLRLEMRGAEMWTEVFDHEVRLGIPIDLADKARALRAMLTEEIPGGAIIDVSSPLRPAIVPIGAQLAVESDGGEG